VRVRITRRPTELSVDGISLSRFHVGFVYAVPVSLATLMVVEGWAEPVVDDADEPVLPPIRFKVARPRERRQRVLSDRLLRTRLGLAADRRHRK
jgi:hypothetical protein